MNTWILCADRSGAKLWFTLGRQLELVRAVDHPEGRLHDSDIDTDQAGRTQARTGGHPHSLPRHATPTEINAKRFAKELAELAQQGRVERRFDRLVLVAEPSFLGLLQGELDGPTREMVSGTVGKHLTQAETSTLARSLRDLLPAIEG